MTLLDDFFWRAMLGGLGVALAAGPLGCFVVWRRMAFFGASIAHAALLGVALGLILAIDPILGIAITGIIFAIAIVLLQRQTRLASDTLLGILAHAALAAGLVAISFRQDLRADLIGYLFGDILAVTTGDLLWIYLGGGLSLAVLVAIWRPLLAMTVHEELARAEGIPVLAIQLVFALLLAIVIAVSMKIVGVLLIVSLLIIPAAAARPFARSPEQMAGMAALIGAVAVAGGLGASFQWDTPSGPSIVIAAFAIFLASLAASAARRR
ncbi:MAG: iron chelate uptake ABC transporter family permease subunit [Alphaproteobacteria bacterium]